MAHSSTASDAAPAKGPVSADDLKADVVVVGAGPAGSSAAYHLATCGLDVILVDKQELGRDKVCGDGLTPSAVRELVRMGVDISTWQRNKGLRVIGGGHRLHIPGPSRPPCRPTGWRAGAPSSTGTWPSAPPTPAPAC